jgi:hypothetical protein
MQAVKETHYKQILRKLQTTDKVSNFELSKITPRYGARIHEIRNDGYDISEERDRGNMFRKPNRSLRWYTLNYRFEVNSRD